MSLNIEELKKKIIYRSTYRGSKEMDIFLSSFLETIINNLNKQDLEKLLDLLNLDDENLYKFRQGKKTLPKIDENRITKLFQGYIHQK